MVNWSANEKENSDWLQSKQFLVEWKYFYLISRTMSVKYSQRRREKRTLINSYLSRSRLPRKDRGGASFQPKLLRSIMMNNFLNSLVQSVLGYVAVAFFACLRLAKKNLTNVSQCRAHALTSRLACHIIIVFIYLFFFIGRFVYFHCLF